jgi:hypothetical protein
LAELCRRDWRSRWQRSTFTTIETIEAALVQRPGADPACEVRIEGLGRHGQEPLRVIEQHVPAGSRRLVVSVAGAPELHARLAAVVSQWLNHACLGA